MRKSVALAFWISAVLLVTGSTAAYAQGSITGAVKDSSGAVLPGVTVEAASPVLIEKVRSVVTDGTGQYKIEQLRPGLYSVTFSLTGFSTVKREGIELTGSFVATVNAELRVGSVQETITVTGESPVVDVQSVTQQRVLTKDVIDAIPTGRSQFNLAALIPGMNTTQDVGGASNLILGSVSLHGGRATDTRTQIDGLPSGNMEQGGQLSNFIPDMGAVQEVAIDYAAASAEVTYDGPRVNLIPKEGGNNIKVSFYFTDVNSSFQGSNYTQDLQDRGLKTPNSIKRNYEYNPGGGGPLVKDKLWFYGSAGWRQNNNYVAGMYRNLNAGDLTKWTYVPDLNNPADSKKTLWNANSRLTWQASQKHKVSVYYDYQGRVEDSINATVAPEAANQYTYPIQKLGSVSWSAPLTSRLLLDVRSSLRGENYVVGHPPPGDPFRMLIPVIEQGGPIAGLLYRGSGQQNSLPFFNVYGFNKTVFASLSYVTGSHSLKVGISDIFGGRNVSVNDNDYSLTYRFNNGVPNQLTEKTTPFRFQQRVRSELGAYVQDKWTVNHMTVNAGLRLDYLDTYHPAQALGPAPLVPTRNFTTPEMQALHWTDLSPRLGVAYDLFGNGKTALKVSLNKFVLAQGLQGVYGDLSHPVRLLANIVTRSWTDANANYVADCNLLNPTSQDLRASGGDFCGAMSDQNFGKATATMAYDPRTLTGFGNRPDNWEFSAGVQHELLARVSLNASFFRRWYGNSALTDNRGAAPSDYSPFSITAPVDPRLPDGGGYQIGGLYDLNPNKVGVVDNYFTLASDYGNQIEHWNGLDISVNARPGRGVLLQGGVSTGRTSTDNCDIVAKVDNPSPLYCHVDTAFLTQIKLLGTYAIPKVDVNFGVTYQSIPGPAIAAIYNAPNALVAPSLGRNLSGGAANVAVNLVEPGVSYGERLNQLDLRFSKVLRYRKSRTLANLDLYNAFNANPVLTQNNNYATWQVPQSILLARFAKISVQFDF